MYFLTYYFLYNGHCLVIFAFDNGDMSSPKRPVFISLLFILKCFSKPYIIRCSQITFLFYCSGVVLRLLYLLNEALKGVVNVCWFPLTLCWHQTLVVDLLIQLNPMLSDFSFCLMYIFHYISLHLAKQGNERVGLKKIFVWMLGLWKVA